MAESAQFSLDIARVVDLNDDAFRIITAKYCQIDTVQNVKCCA